MALTRRNKRHTLFMNFRSSQQGVALVLALLIIALATMTATAMLSEQQLTIRRTANLLNANQAYLYALGAEAWAKRILLLDQQNTQFDSSNELWATPLPATLIPGGTLTGRLEELQGRFNLNNLIIKDKISEVDFSYFQRLLKLLRLSPDIAQVIVDWIDHNQDIHLPNGAEDNAYLIKTPAYRAANQPFISLTELRLIEGIDEEVYHTLIPYVTALPTHTYLNVNTATLPVLLALSEELAEHDVLNLIVQREKQPFKSVDQFLQHDAFAGLTIKADLLGVNTHYFALRACAHIDTGRANVYSLLYREKNHVMTVFRTQQPCE